MSEFFPQKLCGEMRRERAECTFQQSFKRE